MRIFFIKIRLRKTFKIKNLQKTLINNKKNNKIISSRLILR